VERERQGSVVHFFPPCLLVHFNINACAGDLDFGGICNSKWFMHEIFYMVEIDRFPRQNKYI
jgi:hypothetical protein